MHFCRAQIALGGDRSNIFHAGEFSPVSWPEVTLLQYVHGESAIDAVEPFVKVEQTSRAERQRLANKYGEQAVVEVFARQPIHQMEAPKAHLPKGMPWFNPITMKQEVTGEQSADPVVEEPDEPDLTPYQESTETVVDDELPQPTRRRR